MTLKAQQPLVGFVGWRGMVGSVLVDRMQAEGDFALIEPLFFSTSNAGGKAPAQAKNEATLKAASGGGAQHMRELLTQFGTINAGVRALLDDPKSAILEIDRKVLARQQAMSASETENFGVPLGGSLIPWIDKDLGDGVSRE